MFKCGAGGFGGRRFQHAPPDQGGGNFGGFGGLGRGGGQNGSRGRSRRMGRLFGHGDLHLIILRLITERPRSGYDLMKSIEDSVAGAYSPSPGTIYPALALLEDRGFVEVNGEGRAKLYSATDTGRSYLGDNRDVVEAMLARIAEVGASRAAVPAPVVRAMENLKLALQLRMERGAPSEEAARAIAAAIDRAVTEIERS